MIDPALTTMIIIALIAMGFIILFVIPKIRSKYEVRENLIYEERCTGRKNLAFGFYVGGTMPNWRVSFYENYFVIVNFKATKILYREVKSIEYARHIISKGLYIYVSNPKMTVVLFPKKPKKIIEIFNDKKVPISKNRK